MTVRETLPSGHVRAISTGAAVGNPPILIVDYVLAGPEGDVAVSMTHDATGLLATASTSRGMLRDSTAELLAKTLQEYGEDALWRHIESIYADVVLEGAS